MSITRFAPSITGPAHPGTLLSGLLTWLDARARGGEVILRLEDLDRERLEPGFTEGMIQALAWLGLDWDHVVAQSELRAQHERALDELAKLGRLYPCRCSRRDRRASGRRGPDGGFAYDNRCRDERLPRGGWRAVKDASVRARLDDEAISIRDEGGADLSQNPAQDLGDPVVVRRDGAFAYHLVCVVDDAASDVDRVIRGRDLATSTGTQVALQQILRLPRPVYRHHFLLLEDSGDKLAKLHGAIGYPAVRELASAEAWCGRLARVAGLRTDEAPCLPEDLIADFDWSRVRTEDVAFDTVLEPA